MIVACRACQARYDASGHPPGSEVYCRCGTQLEVPLLEAHARTLSCPQCGALASPEQIRCEFCGAYLAVIPCPRCFELVFAGARHCDRCGAEVNAPAIASLAEAQSPRLCPRCTSVHLTARLVAEVPLDQCSQCGGVWLDARSFDRLIAERQQASTLAALGLPQETAGASSSQPVAYLKCPDCGKVMNRKNFARRSGVIIDACKDHGIFFDRGELAAILAFVSRGGMEEAQRRDLEALKEDLRRRQSEVRAPSPFSTPVSSSSSVISNGLLEVGFDALLDRIFKIFRIF